MTINGDPIWAELLSLINVIVNIAILSIEIRDLLDNGTVPKYFRWLKYLFVVVCVYWCWLYLYVLITPSTNTPAWFGAVFVRPALTFTFAVMLAAAIFRRRRSKYGSIQH